MTKVECRVGYLYRWWTDEGEIDDSALPRLHNSARPHIVGLIKQGNVCGDLYQMVDGHHYNGWWETEDRTTVPAAIALAPYLLGVAGTKPTQEQEESMCARAVASLRYLPRGGKVHGVAHDIRGFSFYTCVLEYSQDE